MAGPGGAVFGIVEDSGVYKGSCGYCGGTDSSVSHGMYAHRLSAADYNDLLDRGWRRSGNWVYQPQLATTCCRQYTLRLDVNKFKKNKGQAKVVRKLAAWLAGRNSSSTAGTDADDPAGEQETHYNAMEASSQRLGPQGTQRAELESACLEALPSKAQAHLASTKLRLEEVSGQKAAKLPKGVRFTSPSCFPATAAARRTTGWEGLTPAGLASDVASALTTACEGDSRLAQLGMLRVEAAGGHLNFWMRPDCQPSPSPPVPRQRQQRQQQQQQQQKTCGGQSETDGVLKRPKTEAVSASEAPGAVAARGGGGRAAVELPLRFLGLTAYTGSTLTVEMLPAEFKAEEFALYKKYQLVHHGDTPSDLTESRYSSFLVDTPLQQVPCTLGSGLPPCGLGSFHIQYRVDGHLVAVSVVDVLPRCASSKYFFWDPDYAALSLGKISALYEIFWVQEMAKAAAGFHYYYLGFYIHNCHKMRYKADYHPSDLLCPVEHVWVPYHLLTKMLDDKKDEMCVFSSALTTQGDEQRLADLLSTATEDTVLPKGAMASRNRCPPFTDEQVLNAMVVRMGGLSRLKDVLGEKDPNLRQLEHVRSWCNAVGLCAKRLVYVLPRTWHML